MFEPDKYAKVIIKVVKYSKRGHQTSNPDFYECDTIEDARNWLRTNISKARSKGGDVVPYTTGGWKFENSDGSVDKEAFIYHLDVRFS